jgi:flagellar biosynthesis/type III secretory pathway M-ring protein FliF/YscJ
MTDNIADNANALADRRNLMIAGAIAAVVVVLLVVYLASRGGGEVPLTGEVRQKAIDAAVAEVGEGEITGAEEGNDGTAYEVEIIPPDGIELEVRIDEDFNVVEVVPDD